MKRIQIIYLLLFGCSFTVQTTAQAVSVAELIRVSYTSHEDHSTRDFYLYLPYGYRSSPDRNWPVLMFLHGNGERGNGKDELDWVMVHGPLYEAWVQKRDLPFIMIAPQLPMYSMDAGVDYIQNRNPIQIPKRLQAGVPDRPVEFDTPTEMDGDKAASSFPYLWPPNGWERVAEDLAAIVQTVIDQYRGDRRRVYLTGLSYGSYGTWYMASKYPDLWAAINPVVGWGHPDLMQPIAKHQIPVWAFAGGRDQGIPVKYFYPGLNQLESLGHRDVRFTVHQDMGHDTWRRVYAGEDIYSWFLMHRKKQ